MAEGAGLGDGVGVWGDTEVGRDRGLGFWDDEGLAGVGCAAAPEPGGNKADGRDREGIWHDGVMGGECPIPRSPEGLQTTKLGR